jgi:1,4-alpha-glucan branching enzyme
MTNDDEVANGRAGVPEEIWPAKVGNWFSKKRSTLGAAGVLTSPGMPMLFQGQELLGHTRWQFSRGTDRFRILVAKKTTEVFVELAT